MAIALGAGLPGTRDVIRSLDALTDTAAPPPAGMKEP